MGAPPAVRAAVGLQNGEEWEAQLRGGVTALLLVLTFGWAGSPGEWMPWALGTLCHHRAHRPSQPRRDGPEAFRAEMLMDGAVLVEPELGKRPELFCSPLRLGSEAPAGQGSHQPGQDS